jgi:hypothetical protein
MIKIKDEKIEKYKNKFTKINIWKDKIIELIYNFTISEIKYNTNDECKEIINFIADIINSFIIKPNTMIENIHNSKENIYNYRKYKIFNKYLYYYNTKLNDNDLSNPEFITSQNELKQILQQTKVKKIDDCINQ